MSPPLGRRPVGCRPLNARRHRQHLRNSWCHVSTVAGVRYLASRKVSAALAEGVSVLRKCCAMLHLYTAASGHRPSPRRRAAPVVLALAQRFHDAKPGGGMAVPRRPGATAGCAGRQLIVTPVFRDRPVLPWRGASIVTIILPCWRSAAAGGLAHWLLRRQREAAPSTGRHAPRRWKGAGGVDPATTSSDRTELSFATD